MQRCITSRKREQERDFTTITSHFRPFRKYIEKGPRDENYGKNYNFSAHSVTYPQVYRFPLGKHGKLEE